jgi:hypothetical protein
VVNEILGFLLARGITFAAKPIHLRNRMLATLPEILLSPSELLPNDGALGN